MAVGDTLLCKAIIIIIESDEQFCYRHNVTSIEYAIHGTARVAIVAIPKICGKRLVLFSTKGEFSFAIRDYIFGMMLRSGSSELTVSDIEKLITYSEGPAYRSVDRKNEWQRDLERLSRAHFGAGYDDTTRPAQKAGKWKAL